MTPTGKRGRPEDAVHIPILTWIRNNVRCLVWHTPNGGSRVALEAIRLKALGARKGVHDICILAAGRFYTLEVKAPKGSLEPEQMKFGADVNAHGGLWACVRSKDEAIAQITAWDLPRIDLAAAARRGLAADGLGPSAQDDDIETATALSRRVA